MAILSNPVDVVAEDYINIDEQDFRVIRFLSKPVCVIISDKFEDHWHDTVAIPLVPWAMVG